MRREEEFDSDLLGLFSGWKDAPFDGEEGRFEDEYLPGDVGKLVGLVGNVAKVVAVLLEGHKWIDDAQALLDHRLFGLLAA